jgi:hypothetical protein
MSLDIKMTRSVLGNVKNRLIWQLGWPKSIKPNRQKMPKKL